MKRRDALKGIAAAGLLAAIPCASQASELSSFDKLRNLCSARGYQVIGKCFKADGGSYWVAEIVVINQQANREQIAFEQFMLSDKWVDDNDSRLDQMAEKHLEHFREYGFEEFDRYSHCPSYEFVHIDCVCSYVPLAQSKVNRE